MARRVYLLDGFALPIFRVRVCYRKRQLLLVYKHFELVQVVWFFSRRPVAREVGVDPHYLEPTVLELLVEFVHISQYGAADLALFVGVRAEEEKEG